MEVTCTKCCNKRPIEHFRKRNKSFSKTCKSCTNEMDKMRKKELRRRKQEIFFKCDICIVEKPLKNFAKLKKFYKKKICTSCYPSFVTQQKTEWCRNERKTNVHYRLKKSLASRLRTVLTKTNTTMTYIGCNIQYLREWFEYNFSPEMNWDNYGSYWSIDHIIPVCNFDLTIEEEKYKCWNWTNLVPVTAKYNSSKKKIDIDQINNISIKLKKFKEEGSTTKWFSGEINVSS
jgi:hypothetical protein